MRSIRAALIALAVGLSLGLVAPTPANAAGENCRSDKLAERCADMTGQDGSIYANGGISSKTGRAKVRVVSVSLQYLMGGRWVTNSRTEPEKMWVNGGDYTAATTGCDNAAAGKWRSNTVVQWKRGRDGNVHTGRVVSDPIRRARLCG